MKIGYCLGSASINGGGTAPYAWRVLDLLLSNSKNYNTEILILCTDEVQKNCLNLINKHQAKAYNAKKNTRNQSRVAKSWIHQTPRQRKPFNLDS